MTWAAKIVAALALAASTEASPAEMKRLEKAATSDLISSRNF
jgi:hypothetical protein